MRHIAVLATIALSACSTGRAPKTAPPPQTTAPQTVTVQPAAPAADAAAAAPASGLGDLEAMMFGCPKAGLNAAAREAAKAPAQGRYQFTYFKVVSDSHHSLYEVHFTSNDHEDPELKYCVSVYCQQGWDPTTTKTSVSLMSEPMRGKTTAAAAHGAQCGSHMAPVKPRSKR